MNDKLNPSYALSVLAIFCYFFAGLTQVSAASQCSKPVMPVMSCSALDAVSIIDGIDAGVSITFAQELKTLTGQFLSG
ncbi:hypothetical protein [Pantoea vagans]|uniref:hypothetical protein n=1 Tax=Pantoea vagans TaxID=470934 RepID=UPI0032080FEC